MAFIDFLKKMVLGATDEENKRNKARMREIFNSCVSKGDDYKLLYCHMQNYSNAVLVEVTMHSNFIVGYKTGEVVVIQVDPGLQEHGEAMFFNKDNGSVIEVSMGYCIAANKDIHCQFEPVTYEPGIGKGARHSVSVTQSAAEVAEFRRFFKQGL